MRRLLTLAILAGCVGHQAPKERPVVASGPQRFFTKGLFGQAEGGIQGNNAVITGTDQAAKYTATTIAGPGFNCSAAAANNSCIQMLTQSRIQLATTPNDVYISSDGANINFAGAQNPGLTTSSFIGVGNAGATSNLVYANTATQPVQFRGQVATGGVNGAAVRLDNLATLTTPGDQIADFVPGNIAGGINPAASITYKGLFNLYGTSPRRQGVYQTIDQTQTAFTAALNTAIGFPNPTLLAGTPTNSTTDTTVISSVLFTSGAVSGNASGIAGPFASLSAATLPLVYATVRLDPSAITTVRYIFGFGASSLDQVGTLAGVNTIRGCWFRYDTGLDTTIQALSSDGTTASATDTTVTPVANTSYTLLVDASVASECDFWINGVRRVQKTTNPPAGATALGVEASVTTLGASARALSVSKIIVQQN